MIITGTHNTADVKIDNIDQTTREQLEAICNKPEFADYRLKIMPDCHAGAGCVIGLTSPIGKYIMPNLVGVDIGCGVLGLNLGKIDIDLKSLDRYIKQNIPSGFSVRKDIIKPEETKAFGVEDILSNISSVGGILGFDEHTINRHLHSLGTLGGGNHFIEIGRSKQTNDLWLIVHTGSRKFGLDIANYYQKQNDPESDFKEEGILLASGALGKNYLMMATCAQMYAFVNRRIIAYQIAKYLDVDISGNCDKRPDLKWGDQWIVDSVHNYIDVDTGMLRKGAISARKGQKVLIPLNMVDGTLLAIGKGNPDWNYSAPHGAGRVLSRGQAKRTLDLDNALQVMKDSNIYTSSLSKNTLDEFQTAYKNVDVIKDAISETVDILEEIIPIYNFKAGE
jgi:tRNA-splicing ligase RtcB